MDISKYKNLKEFDNHALIVKVYEPSVGLNGFIVIDRKGDNFPALGATRLWSYASEDEALNDALRLAKLMKKKSAIADLPYSGAKAVLMLPPGGISNREEFFKIYAQKLNELSGQFITGTDVGLTDTDLKVMGDNSPFVIGLGVPAAYFTARSVFSAIKASLGYSFGSEEIFGRNFAIQGLGKTGYELLRLLYKEGVGKIFVSELNSNILDRARQEFPLIKVIPPKEIHKQEVDVFCPCALSHAISCHTIGELNCAIVAGSANNQLEDDSMGERLHELSIIYAPDYIANGGGLISVVDQFENKFYDEKRIMDKLNKLKEKLKIIYKRSKENNLSINSIANTAATNIINSESPMN